MSIISVDLPASIKVHKQYLDLSQLHVDKDQVKMGPLALSNNFLSGKVNSVNVDLSFRLSNGSNHFLPVKNRLFVLSSTCLSIDAFSKRFKGNYP